MIWFLWILISLAVYLVIFDFFSSEGRVKKDLKGNFKNATELSINQLKDRVLSLEGESKKVNQICLSIRDDLLNLKEKDLSLIIKLLEGKDIFKKGERPSSQNNLKLQEYAKTIELLREELEELSNKLIRLALEVKRLEAEGAKKDCFIDELKIRQAQLKKLLEEVRLRFKEVTKELSDTKTRELKLRADLFKQKTIYSDSEKEIERLTGDNAELRDGLSYELHN